MNVVESIESGYHKTKSRKTEKELDGYHTPGSERKGINLGRCATAISNSE